MYMYVFLCMDVYTGVQVPLEDRKRFQILGAGVTVVSHPLLVLGMKLGLSARAVCVCLLVCF